MLPCPCAICIFQASTAPAAADENNGPAKKHAPFDGILDELRNTHGGFGASYASKEPRGCKRPSERVLIAMQTVPGDLRTGGLPVGGQETG